MGSHSGAPSLRCPGRRTANSTRSLLPGTVATLVAYCSMVSTWSSSAASCISPKMPRVLGLLSTRLRAPTSRARVCISPRPLCTCSSRSATCVKLSPRRCCSVACSFSSTVARICSSFFSLPSCSAFRRCSTAARISLWRRSLVSPSRRSCSASVSLTRRKAASTCCCMPASWMRKESICSFCVRATSPACVSSTCCKVPSSARVACAWRPNSSRISRSRLRSRSRQGDASLRRNANHSSSARFSETSASSARTGQSSRRGMPGLSQSRRAAD